MQVLIGKNKFPENVKGTFDAVPKITSVLKQNSQIAKTNRTKPVDVERGDILIDGTRAWVISSLDGYNVWVAECAQGRTFLFEGCYIDGEVLFLYYTYDRNGKRQDKVVNLYDIFYADGHWHTVMGVFLNESKITIECLTL